MAKRSWVQIDGKLVPKHEVVRDMRGRSDLSFPMIMTDIQPYKSIITGEEIGSRSRHREHLAEHGCEEIGSEKPAWMAEQDYVESHGGTYTHPGPDLSESEGVSFAWEDPVL